MTLKIEAVYENGVFVPANPPALADHERVRLTVETVAPTQSAPDVVNRRQGNRIRIDPQLANEIALSPEFDSNET